MSYFLTPLAVDCHALVSAIGSNDQQLLATLINDYGSEFGVIEEMIADNADDAAEMLTVEAILTQMLTGQPYHPQFGFAYGYALQFLCMYFGEPLPNGEWCSLHLGWFDTLDQTLQQLSVDPKVLTVTHLVYGGAPVELPEIADFPGIGHMRLRDIKAALKELPFAKFATIADEPIRMSLEEMHGWFETCVESKRDLVCFLA